MRGGNSGINLIEHYRNTWENVYVYDNSGNVATNDTFFLDKYNELKTKYDIVGINHFAGSQHELTASLSIFSTFSLKDYKIQSSSNSFLYGAKFYAGNCPKSQTVSHTLNEGVGLTAVASGTNANINWTQYKVQMLYEFPELSEVYAITDATTDAAYSAYGSPYGSTRGIHIYSVTIYDKNKVALGVEYLPANNNRTAMLGKYISVTAVGK